MFKQEDRGIGTVEFLMSVVIMALIFWAMIQLG